LFLVKELQACGVQLIWFEGEIAAARREFIKSGRAVANFDTQIASIRGANLPKTLVCKIVPALSREGVFLTAEEIDQIIFGGGEG
jgi:hypothetical protein